MSNRSGNFGVHEWSSDEGNELFEQLSQEALRDPLWNDNAGNIFPGGRCIHCKHWVGNDAQVQIQHVLNGCKSFKTQRRYHWRHETLLDYIGTLLEKNTETEGFRCYVDVPGRRTHDEGTVPDQLIITDDKPDIFILDQRDHLQKPEIVIIDLTIPWDDRVEASRSEKLVKFSTLVATIKAKDAFNVSYQSLEIGSYRQRLSDGSESAIKLLYNYIIPKISYYAFRKDLINLVNYSSYEIFSSRNETKWNLSIYPAPPIPDEDQVQDEADLATVTDLVEKISTTSSETTENSSENSFLIKDENEIQTESEILNQLESIKEFQSQELEDPNYSSYENSKENDDENLRFSVYQLLAILLVFCLLLFALNVMWNNFYTTLFISLVSFPILRWFGKI